MTKKNPLEVGQKVWLETLSMFLRSEGENRIISEYQIVEANSSSAYAVPLDVLDEYNRNIKRHSYFRRRITQRNHKVKSDGFGGSYILWLSEESFENNVKYNKDLVVARKKAHETVGELTLAGLENLIDRFE